MKFFFINLTAILVSADLFIWWLGARSLRRSGATHRVRLGYHLFFAVQTGLIATIFVARLNKASLDPWLPTPLTSAVFIWHLLLLPLALVGNLLGLTGKGLAALARLGRKRRPAPSAPPLDSEAGTTGTLSRRQFLARTAFLTPPLLNIALTGLATAQVERFRTRRLTVTLPQLPPALDGLTIAHLSDTHVGRFTHGSVLQRIADATNKLEADLVLFTGDLLNDSLYWLPKATGFLQAIRQPVYVCEGNHDLIDNKEAFRETLANTEGVHFLRFSSMTIPLKGERIQIFGSPWSRVDTPEVTHHLLAQRDPTATFAIHLIHHPHVWDHDDPDPAKASATVPVALSATPVPLTLAGHTHGGQLMVNESRGFGPMMYRYWTGLYTRGAGAQSQALVVSNGVGNWFPLRSQALAEIIHLTLRRSGSGEADEKREAPQEA